MYPVPKLPPLESLRVLEACVRHQNMTLAANELGVTPAAVSLRVRDLEAELGTPLFWRRGPRIIATDAGSALGARLSALLSEVEVVVDACREARAPIRITAVPTLAARWLAGALAEYQQTNPGIHVVVDSTETLRPVGSFDLSVRCGSGNWKGLTAIQMFSGEATPMVAPNFAGQIQTPADLAQLPLVPDNRWTAWFRQFGSVAQGLRFTADYPSQDLAATAIAAGAGAALLHPILFDRAVQEGKLIRPFDEVVEGPEPYFVAVSQNEGRATVLRLRDFLLDSAKLLTIDTESRKSSIRPLRSSVP